MQNGYHTQYPAKGSPKRAVKAGLGFLAYAARLNRRLLGERAVVVAFHRISDSAGASLNCPPSVFAGLCALFKRHFSVIPLSELVQRLSQNAPIGNMLSITFDDGYKDNFAVAAPILHNLGLPATFFVATNFIGSDTVPFWDQQEGVKSEWMSWDDVRELRAMGFDIGGHTMNHANLGQIPLAEAAREIDGCRKTLADRLAADVTHFAYPFGGIGNITPAVRELVAASGFTCCLSCHGGIISAGDDVFDLRREPINSWVTSPYQYGFELLLKATEAGK
jgi:peptidoglycan/xylan/chitin deacetylase (PgdA/CDA1 family)